VLFGSGTSTQLAGEISALGCSRALILSTPQQVELAEKTRVDIGPLATATFTGAAMHTPVAVTDEAIKNVEQSTIDCLVPVGGGSTIGLSKAIALRTGLPQIAIPTTYAGSEMTPILGQTEDGVKTTQRTIKVLPEVVIYDVDLTLTLPTALSVTSGINAMAHAIEALYAENRNPVISMLAEEGIRALYRTLEVISDKPSDVAARREALFGAWLCGTSLGSVGMALHHKLCHTLGGTFDLPHAETHTVLLPYVTAFNAVASWTVLGLLNLSPPLVCQRMGLTGLPNLLSPIPTSTRENLVKVRSGNCWKMLFTERRSNYSYSRPRTHALAKK